MGRPRKNRVGEYAALFSEELLLQVQNIVSSEVDASLAPALAEISDLKQQLVLLQRRLDTLSKAKTREPLGRWVPGGPGRPPKDAEARVAAFKTRSKKPRK